MKPRISFPLPLSSITPMASAWREILYSQWPARYFAHVPASPTAASAWDMSLGETKNLASERNASSSPCNEATQPRLFAATSTPITPLIVSPNPRAAARPSDSSISRTASGIPSASAMASVSPGWRPGRAGAGVPGTSMHSHPSDNAFSTAARPASCLSRESSVATAGGMVICPWSRRRNSRRPTIARLLTGEVSLTTRIRQIVRQIVAAVVPGDAALAHFPAEIGAGHPGQPRALREGKRAFGIQSHGDLQEQPCLPLFGLRRQLRGDGIGKFDRDLHTRRLSAATPGGKRPQLRPFSVLLRGCQLLAFLVFALPFFMPLSASAETLRYDFTAANSRDLFIRSSVPGQVFDSFQLRVGGWGDTYQTLLYFPVATLPQVATQARLFVYCYGHSSGSGGSSVAMDLHRVTSDWTNATTWNSQPTSVQVTALPAAAAGNWYQIDITTLYNQWKSGTANYGIKLTPQGNSNQWNEFYSADHTDPALKPYVLIDYPSQGANTSNTHRAAFVRASSQHFTAADSPSLSITGPITLEAWIKPTSVDSTTQIAIGKGRNSTQTGYSLGVTSSNKFSFGRAGDFQVTVDSNQNVLPGQWHHVAGVFDGTNHYLYINGALVNSSPGTLTIADSSEPLLIGNEATGLPRYFGGLIDEVRVWSLARTQDQIRIGMFQELPGTETGLRAYWKLNGSSVDFSPNGNPLTAINAPTFATNDLPFSSNARQLPFCPDRDTRALFHLEDTSDSSPQGYTLSNNGSVSFPSGKFANSADFGNANTNKSLIAAGNLGISGGTYTIGLWVKPNVPITNGVWNLIQLADDATDIATYIAYAYNGGSPQIRFYRMRGGISFGQANCDVTLGTQDYSFLAITYDGSTVRGYFNGVQVTSLNESGNGSFSVSPSELTIGAGRSYSNGTLGDYASMSVDEVVVSSRAFPSEEIMKYYGGIVSARFAADASDALLRKVGPTWAGVRNASSADALGTANSDYMTTEKVAVDYGIQMPFFPFDTSKLPASGIGISHAALNVYLENDSGGFRWNCGGANRSDRLEWNHDR